MKCYRVYYKDELMGTFFNLIQAVAHMDLFLSQGYEDCKIEIEKF